ncbi:hypothetical protein VTH06DRAFT_2636 [Thermothelomyces fergusii]
MSTQQNNMTDHEHADASFDEDDHRAAFIFNSASTSRGGSNNDHRSSRPYKRRKLAQAGASDPQQDVASGPAFPPLFNGAESPDAVKLRKDLFETAWPVLETRIQHVLREANRNTLDEVTSFLEQAADADMYVCQCAPLRPPNEERKTSSAH